MKQEEMAVWKDSTQVENLKTYLRIQLKNKHYLVISVSGSEALASIRIAWDVAKTVVIIFSLPRYCNSVC